MNDEVLATISCAPENGVLQIREPTTIQERMLIRQSAKLAERDAEVADARETLFKALDADMDRDEPLRMLATRASNALYWRTERAEAAERAREEATGLLREVHRNGWGQLTISDLGKSPLLERIAAFLAANGGRDHG